MMKARRFALAFVLAAVALWAPTTGGAEAPESVGWWWKGNVPNPLAPVPAPPTVPAGGLYVAGDPTGPFGLSALRLFIPENTLVGPLVLRVASAQGPVNIRACPTPIPWAPEHGGQMTGAPPADCGSGFAFGVHDDAAGTVTFEVSPLVRPPYLNIVLVPADGAVFQVSFQPPGPDAITLTPGPSGPSDPGPSPAFEEPFTEGPAFSDPLVVDSQQPLFEPGFAPVVTTSTTAPPRRVPIFVTPQTARPAAQSGKDREALIASFVFTGLLGLFWFLLSRGRPAPAEEPTAAGRGVGRFRRPRVGVPPPL